MRKGVHAEERAIQSTEAQETVGVNEVQPARKKLTFERRGEQVTFEWKARQKLYFGEET